MDFLKLCADRYSVRSFSDTPIPDDVLNQILEAGRLAPTAMNLQPQRIFVILGTYLYFNGALHAWQIVDEGLAEGGCMFVDQ